MNACRNIYNFGTAQWEESLLNVHALYHQPTIGGKARSPLSLFPTLVPNVLSVIVYQLATRVLYHLKLSSLFVASPPAREARACLYGMLSCRLAFIIALLPS